MSSSATSYWRAAWFNPGHTRRDLLEQFELFARDLKYPVAESCYIAAFAREPQGASGRD